MNRPNSIHSHQLLISLFLSWVLFAPFLDGQDKKESKPALFVKTYRVPDSFHSYLQSMTQPDKKLDSSTALEKAGMTFPEGTTAIYNRKESTLVVKHNKEGFELLEVILDSMRKTAEQSIHIYQEWIEVDHDLFSKWLFENRLDDEGTKLRNQVQQWIEQGKATIIDSALVTGKSGQRAKVESVDEYIYPTEYDPPEIPNSVTLKNGAEAPVTSVTPTAFETRNLGTTLEVDPVLSADHKIVDLNLAPEIVKLEKLINWHHKQPDVRFQIHLPIFHTQKITTLVTTRAGSYAFLGTTRPLAPADPKITKNPIVLQFVRPDVSSLGDWSVLDGE